MKKALKLNGITIALIVAIILLGTGLTAVAIITPSQQQNSSNNTITVHYYNSASWESPYIYCYYNNQGVHSWPGAAMTSDGDNWYSYTLSNFNEARVIFSNNGNNQNPGQNEEGYLVEGEMWYCNGNWYDQEPQSTIVHYYNSDNWSNVNLYYYQNGLNNPNWPGVAMQSEGGNWFKYKIIGFSNPKVIFSNNGNNQNPGANQEGFSVSGEMWYKNGQWYTEDPTQNEARIKVHFYNYNNWNNVNVYYYSNGVTTPSWPGSAMTSEGDGWYKYEIIGVENPKVIFSNNGSNQIPAQNQEGFTVTSESWYRNGTWYESRPLDVVVYFYKPSDWNTPNIYYYLNDNDTGPAWPGVQMTDAGNGWYKYNITKYSNPKVLFNDGTHQIPGAGESGISAQGVVWVKNEESYTYNPDTIENNETVGDLNGDGIVDENDYILLQNYIDGDGELTEEQLKLADTNGDGVVDERDKEILNDYIEGEITEFPVENKLKNKNASYEYDKLGRVTKVIYDENNYVEYTYDSNGNITNVNVVGNVEE